MDLERNRIMDLVLVTGVSGYVGQHVAAELLKAGFRVRGTVRDMAKSSSVLKNLQAVVDTSNLEFVVADLLKDAGWDDAVKGCSAVLHIASPFVLAVPKNENELIEPAVEGTKRVLNAAKRAWVKRVVLTSSAVAMTSGRPSGTYGTDAWSDLSADIGAYAKSKTMAEQVAWELVADGEMELVSINPGFMLGPAIGASGDGQSISMISGLISGKFPLVPQVAMGMVDVRDVAKLQVAALKNSDSAGKRYIASSPDPVSMATLTQILRGAGYSKAPSIKAPNFLIRLMSLFDREAKGMVPELGRKISYDISETLDNLKWEPTTIEQSILEMAASISK
jgi:dihydroflavonol-4-reductase